MEYGIQLAAAFLGSLGFAVVFNVKKDKLLWAALGGLLSWGVYLMTAGMIQEDGPRFFVASIALTLYAEGMARWRRTPATLFLVPATIPLIPGGSLYTTMRYAVEGQHEAFIRQGIATLLLAAAIASGILCAMTLWTLLVRIACEKKKFP